jgi:hypothetical protein
MEIGGTIEYDPLKKDVEITRKTDSYVVASTEGKFLKCRILCMTSKGKLTLEILEINNHGV